MEVISDWTFSSPYKGSIRWLSDRKEGIKRSTALDIPTEEVTDNPTKTFRVELTDE